TPRALAVCSTLAPSEANSKTSTKAGVNKLAFSAPTASSANPKPVASLSLSRLRGKRPSADFLRFTLTPFKLQRVLSQLFLLMQALEERNLGPIDKHLITD